MILFHKLPPLMAILPLPPFRFSFAPALGCVLHIIEKYARRVE
jgi:hypothetical protein